MAGLGRSLPARIGICALIALVMVGCQRSILYLPDNNAPEPGQPGVQVVRLLSEPDLELAVCHVLQRPQQVHIEPRLAIFI